jgi:hypothetical protein
MLSFGLGVKLAELLPDDDYFDLQFFLSEIPHIQWNINYIDKFQRF